MNPEVLIERWRAGDELAAEMIYQQHREKTFRLAYGLLGNTEDAEEAAQDALSYALLHIHQFDDRKSQFTTWLYRITVSRSRDILRKRRLPAYSLSSWLRDGHNATDFRPGPEQRAEKKRKPKFGVGCVANPLTRSTGGDHFASLERLYLPGNCRDHKLPHENGAIPCSVGLSKTGADSGDS